MTTLPTSSSQAQAAQITAAATSRPVRVLATWREAAYWISGVAMALVMALVTARTQGTGTALAVGLTALAATVACHWVGLKRQHALAELQREQG